MCGARVEAVTEAAEARCAMQEARLRAVEKAESKLAAVRRALAQGQFHKMIMHGRQYIAYDHGEAPAGDAARAEMEDLGYILIDL